MNGLNGLEHLLLNNSAAIAMAGGFIWYLSKKDKLLEERNNNFNKIIENHLNSSTNVIKDNSTAYRHLAIQIQKLSNSINDGNKNISSKNKS